MTNLTYRQKLYGRKKEIDFLNHSYERVGKGVGEIITVAGHSGVGKTALVKQLQTPVNKGNGFFASGKFEQYQKNIPYFAFRQALSEIYLQLASDNKIQKEKFKNTITDAMGDKGQLLIDLVPQFEQLLGPQSPLGEISPQEARYRFAEAIRGFLKVICTPEHPLVIFIDDWQWADTASFELLKMLNVGISLRYILVIISFRDNEITKGHLLNATLNSLKLKNAPLSGIKVKNLNVLHVQELLSDTFEPEIRNSEELANLIHKKTTGNPFFIHSLLNHLKEIGLLWNDETNNQWTWEITQLNQESLPDHAVNLFAERFQKLPSNKKNLLSLAACLGNRFNVEFLSIISEISELECMAQVKSEELNKFVQPYSWLKESTSEKQEKSNIVFVFVHDKMQQAALLTIDNEKLPGILLKISRILTSYLSEEKLNEQLFEVVQKYNAGHALIHKEEEKIKLIGLNLKAGKKAFAATAYSEALKFYRAAGDFFKSAQFFKGMIKNHHTLTLSYLKAHAECEFIEGNQIKGEKLINKAVLYAKTTTQKAEAYNILITQYTLLARYNEAIEVGKIALKTLGIDLPEENYTLARNKEIETIRHLLKQKKVSDLELMPPMTDPNMLLACKILITMGPPCYRSHQKLWSVMVPIVVKLTVKHGNIPQVGYSHTAMGGLLGWVDNDYGLAKEFSQLATNLMTKQFKIPAEQSVFYLMIGSSIRHWFKHLRYGSQDYTDAYETGLRSGNLQYATYAFGHNMYNKFYQGIALDALIADTETALEFSKARHNHWAIELFQGGLMIMNTLTTRSHPENMAELPDDKYFIEKVGRHGNIQVTCIYKIMKTFMLIIFNRYHEALELSEEVKGILYTVGTQGLLPWPEYVFARFHILACLYNQANKATQKQWLNEMKKAKKQIKVWAKYCPENFKHKYLAVLAELERINNNPIKAYQLYHKALLAARHNDFVQWEGLYYERIYDLWITIGNTHLAYQYWEKAYICYEQWGTAAKVKQMELAYKMYLDKSLTPYLNKKGTSSISTKNAIHTVHESQLSQVKKLSSQLQLSKKQKNALQQAHELAEATKRLRHEIASRKAADELIKQQNSDLQKINAEKDKFFSIIAHDLKSPFNSIMGLSQLLIKKVKQKNVNDIEHLARIILSSSGEAMELLKNLMEWSQSQTGRLAFNPKKTDLVALINKTEKLFKSNLQQKQITVTKELPEQAAVMADEAMVETVMRNLVSNAIKFSDTLGKINLKATKHDDSVVVSVKDNGIGISDKNLEKLFHIDSNFSTRGTQNEKGTGLGLVLCKEFISQHKGTIWVDSIQGKGSTFLFSLPIH